MRRGPLCPRVPAAGRITPAPVPALAPVLALALLLALALAGAAVPEPPARADTVTPDAAPALRFVSYNICGNMCGAAPYDDGRRIDSVVTQAAVATWNADQVFLQEVCRPQYDEILRRLAPLGFDGSYAATLVGRASVCGGADYGNAVLVKGPVTDSVELDLTVGGESEPITVPCVRSLLRGRVSWACSVHLYWDDGTLAAPEAQELASRAEAWEAQGLPVVLGGDFNHSPRTSTLTHFYDPSVGDGGQGVFLEADETDTDFFDPAVCTAGPTAGSDPLCRSGEPTWNEKKIDYIFFSACHFTTPRGDSLPRDPLVSDHRMLRGAAAARADCGPLDSPAAAAAPLGSPSPGLGTGPPRVGAPRPPRPRSRRSAPDRSAPTPPRRPGSGPTPGRNAA
ncbi:endonuclease/exonuclease/phosphatase family protein [Streptomyces sp. NPDC101206]|uniref:endonuclease/exonuclease/phosphatase family protein n=1 Tax=Streptomyces sp. NPDC101206 TaxID=3366128 RepID=UPI00381D48CA